MNATDLVTAPMIAELENVREHHVRYAIRTRRIQPQATIGRLPVYGPEAVEQVRRALAEIRQHGRTATTEAQPEAVV